MPVARSEKDWYPVMENYLGQLRQLLDKYNRPPLVVAGDVFHDGWRPKACPPELVNFAIAHLPKCYAVPGQHDLPHHRYDEIRKSAYWTLMEAGVVKDLKPDSPVTVQRGDDSVTLYGFPWGVKVKPRKVNMPHSDVKLAVVHSYVWSGSYCYPGAPKAQRTKAYFKRLKGYDAAVFGDNHKGFLVPAQAGKPEVFNCGHFIRTNSDEQDYKPMVGKLYGDGRIIPHFLDTSKDEWNEKVEDELGLKELGVDTAAVKEAINELGDVACDFFTVVKEFMRREDVKRVTQTWLTNVLEELKNDT